MEIEYKFLVKALPNLSLYSKKHITQGYISTDPVIRLRQMDDCYFLCVKSKGHIIREEYELPLTKEQFTHLWEKVENTPIIKDRYFIPLLDTVVAELDVYSGPLESLVTVEVEFPTLEAASVFTPPAWFGEDISRDFRYKNNTLALHGLPK